MKWLDMRHIKKRTKASWEFVFCDGQRSFLLQIPVSEIRNFELIRVVFGSNSSFSEIFENLDYLDGFVNFLSIVVFVDSLFDNQT